MKRGMKLFALLAIAGAAACSDEAAETFYKATYPVVRIDATVTLDEETTPDDSGDETTGEETSAGRPFDEGAETEAMTAEALREHVIANAPVQPGGSYTLEYSKADGGKLHVDNGKSSTQTGTFVKEPGSTTVQFLFGRWDYIGNLATESDDRTTIIVDLTETYRLLFPDARIASVVRTEYTYEE